MKISPHVRLAFSGISILGLTISALLVQAAFKETPLSRSDLYSSLLNVDTWFDETLTDPETLLLMGKQGDNVDTLMLARVYPASNQARLISIPRDLYVDGMKINAFAFTKSLDAQVAVVERVTGMDIDHYVLVDLEAFRSIVDLMGGIDVTLSKDLVDPTYVIAMEDGSKSTLNYPAGTYHLDGTAALRIARSRHTTSDYDRAERQQLIVEAMKVKAKDLQLEDFSTAFQILATAFRSVTTDFSYMDVAQRLRAYGDLQVESKGVLSTANVLSSVPVPVAYVTSFQKELCEESEGQMNCHPQYYIYTLAPINNDWNKISSWVQAALTE